MGHSLIRTVYLLCMKRRLLYQLWHCSIYLSLTIKFSRYIFELNYLSCSCSCCWSAANGRRHKNYLRSCCWSNHLCILYLSADISIILSIHLFLYLSAADPGAGMVRVKFSTLQKPLFKAWWPSTVNRTRPRRRTWSRSSRPRRSPLTWRTWRSCSWPGEENISSEMR